MWVHLASNEGCHGKSFRCRSILLDVVADVPEHEFQGRRRLLSRLGQFNREKLMMQKPQFENLASNLPRLGTSSREILLASYKVNTDSLYDHFGIFFLLQTYELWGTAR